MNWVDFLALGIVVAVVVLQMLRLRFSFSLICYETVFITAAALATDKLLPQLVESVRLSAAVLYLGSFLILGGFGIVIATLINRVFGFEAGRSRYAVGLLLALVCGLVLAHVVLKEIVIAAGPRAAVLAEAVARSASGEHLVHVRFLNRLIPGLVRAD